ncbi:MAG: hypothetical protein IH986_08465 [Planctomycetes bacterium]|nr:hypothetical protein [Planctomycetota bacterium]
MWIDRLLSSKVTNGIELSARFAEERQRVLAVNVANIHTPDYQTRRLDLQSFQASLREALRMSSAKDGHRLKLRGNAQFSTTPSGRTEVRPAIDPAQNILFHDGTNARIERMMSDAAKNALQYQFMTTLLGGRYDGLLNAIRGRTA